jgi:hypothetical protein
MPGKNLQQAVATFVKRVRGRVQPLLADVTSLEVSTYGVDAPQLESVAASQDVATLAQRQGYTRVTFQCDLNGCLETGREDEVEALVRPMHSAMVEMALAERAKLLDAIRQHVPG